MTVSSDDESTNNGNDGDKHFEVPPTLPSWFWACCQRRVVYPNTLSDSIKSDLVVARGSMPLDFNKLPTFHATTMSTEVLVLEGTVAELPLVHAKAKRDQQDVPFLTSGMKGI